MWFHRTTRDTAEDGGDFVGDQQFIEINLFGRFAERWLGVSYADALINWEMTVKRLSIVDGQMTLTADNQNCPDVRDGDFDESMIWGVVTNVIHQL